MIERYSAAVAVGRLLPTYARIHPIAAALMSHGAWLPLGSIAWSRSAGEYGSLMGP